MKTILTAIVLAALTLTTPAGATPTQRDIVAYDEMMMLTPGLEYLGYSRITTVEACEDETGRDHTALITDSDFEEFETCLISYN
jgi:hypothetical protein